jgi:hypothetical protein
MTVDNKNSFGETDTRSSLGQRKEAVLGYLRSFSAFRRAEDGSMIVFSLFIFLIMLMVGGLAVDVIFLETQRTRLQYTLDRAILAAASLDQDLDPEFVVRDYFEKAGLTGFDLDIDHETIESGGMRNYRRVSVATSLEVDTSFMRLAGVHHLSSPATGAAEEGITDVEISLVVDVSGSMGWSSSSGKTKLYELQAAAREFGYAMLCNPSDPDRENECTVEDGRVSLSIIPYSEQVDVGADLAEQYGVIGDHDYSQCVDFSSNDFKSTGVSMAGDLLQSAHFDRINGSNDTPSYFYCDAAGSGRSIQPFLDDYNDVDTFVNALYANGSTSIDQGMKWGVALLDPAAQPAIKAITEKDTPIIDPVFSTRPLPFGDGINVRDSSKVVVLMTDGSHQGRGYMTTEKRKGASPVFQELVSGDLNLFIYDLGRFDEGRDAYWDTEEDQWVSSPGTYEITGYEEQCEWQKKKKKWYWVCVDEPLYTFIEADIADADAVTQLTWPALFAIKTTDWVDDYDLLRTPLDSMISSSTQDINLYSACDAAKDEAVLIFTIGFEVDDDNLDIMRDCASTPNHFFDVDGTEISEAFAAIASQINRLRLTQ